MRLTKTEKKILADLVQNEITILTETVNKKQSPAMGFESTKKYIKELDEILKKLKGEG